MRSTERMDPISAKFGCVLLMLFGTVGVPFIASGGNIHPGTALAGFISAVLVIAGLFGFMSCLKNEAVAELRALAHDLQSQLARIQNGLEEKSKPTP